MLAISKILSDPPCNYNVTVSMVAVLAGGKPVRDHIHAAALLGYLCSGGAILRGSSNASHTTNSSPKQGAVLSLKQHRVNCATPLMDRLR